MQEDPRTQQQLPYDGRERQSGGQYHRRVWVRQYWWVVALAALVIGLGVVALLTHKSPPAKQVATGNRTQQQQAQADNPVVNWASEAAYQQLPACNGEQLLSVLPTDWRAGSDFLPIGLVNATGGHATPSDHPYYNWNGAVPLTALVKAPGDGLVTKIRHITRTVNGIASEDSTIAFMPCKQVVFYFNHVDSLVPALSTVLQHTTAKNCQDMQASTTESEHDCYYLLAYAVKAGTHLGSVAVTDQKRGFDFGAQDARIPALTYVNAARQETGSFHGLDAVHTACPFDYFPPDVQKLIYASPSLAKRPPDTPCGEVMQDKPATIQGNWYAEPDLGKASVAWEKTLSIVHYFLDPSTAEISVGGTIANPGGIMAFGPVRSGTINREPGETTVGPLYCYTDNPGSQRQSTYGFVTNHHILVQLTDVTTMKIEYKAGANCSASEAFSSPTIYYR